MERSYVTLLHAFLNASYLLFKPSYAAAAKKSLGLIRCCSPVLATRACKLSCFQYAEAVCLAAGIDGRACTKLYRQFTNNVMCGVWQVTGAEKILFGLDDIAGQPEVIIVEGEMDKLAFEEAGFLNVVSVPDGAPQVLAPPAPAASTTPACVPNHEGRSVTTAGGR